jgi:hypothetical protein
MPSDPNAPVWCRPYPGKAQLLLSSFEPARTAFTIQANGTKSPE